MATLVKFYKELSGVVAVFPQLKRFNGYKYNVTCYSHVGQHSEGDKSYFENLSPASPEEYEPLKTELESIGYKLKICKA